MGRFLSHLQKWFFTGLLVFTLDRERCNIAAGECGIDPNRDEVSAQDDRDDRRDDDDDLAHGDLQHSGFPV